MMATLPPSKLNRLPEGLLSFFDIKSMGQYPTRLSETLLGTMDLTRFYADRASEEGIATVSPFLAASNAAAFGNLTGANWIAGGATNFAGSAAATETVVPQNELWLILEAQCQWNFTATAGQEVAVTLMSHNQTAGAGVVQVITDSSLQGFTTSSATIARAGWYQQTEPFFALPNARIRPFTGGALVPGGQIDLAVSMRIRRLRL